ncbi:MAG: hypothetical protein AMXMBFR61_08800 [Fimbriimonadales bacterium]
MDWPRGSLQMSTFVKLPAAAPIANPKATVHGNSIASAIGFCPPGAHTCLQPSCLAAELQMRGKFVS